MGWIKGKLGLGAPEIKGALTAGTPTLPAIPDEPSILIDPPPGEGPYRTPPSEQPPPGRPPDAPGPDPPPKDPWSRVEPEIDKNRRGR